MGSILSMLRKVEALDTDKVINQSIDETAEALEEINRQRMNEGVKSDGSTMPKYSFISQTVYGYPDTAIKLKNTGAFQRSITVKREGDKIVQTSTDEKTELLVDKYGEEIFGVMGAKFFKDEYKDENLLPAIQRNITKETGLSFGKK